jgi:hypothetical protein
MKIISLILFAALAAPTQMLHITGTHKATRDDEKTYSTSFNQNIITATIGNRRYTLEQLASWGYYHFEIGTDYEVVSVDDKAIKVRATDKKGRVSTEKLNVVSVDEITK